MPIAFIAEKNSKMKGCSAPGVVHNILEIVRKYRKRSSMTFLVKMCLLRNRKRHKTSMKLKPLLISKLTQSLVGEVA